MPLLDRTFAWGFRRILKSNYDSQLVTQVLNWVVRLGPKPDLVPPKLLHMQCAS